MRQRFLESGQLPRYINKSLSSWSFFLLPSFWETVKGDHCGFYNFFLHCAHTQKNGSLLEGVRETWKGRESSFVIKVDAILGTDGRQKHGLVLLSPPFPVLPHWVLFLEKLKMLGRRSRGHFLNALNFNERRLFDFLLICRQITIGF